MNKKQSILIWLSFFMLLSLATLSVVFAQTAGVKSVYDNASKSWVTVTPSPTPLPTATATATPNTNEWHTVVVTEEITVTGTDGVTSTVIVTNTVVNPPTTKIVTEYNVVTETAVITDSQGVTHTVVVTRREPITSTVRVEPPTPTPLPPPSTKVITESVVITHDDGNISNITFTRTVPFVPEGLPTRLVTETIRITDTNGVGVNIDVWVTVPIYPTPTPVPTSTPQPTQTPWPTSAWKPSPTPSWIPTATPTPIPVIPWRGQYFTNPEFTGQPSRTRNDDTVDFAWGNGAPMPGMPSDYFAARWTFTETDLTPGFYRVRAVSDYGMRFAVNGQNVVDEIRNFNTNPKTAYFWSEGNQQLNYRYDYFHHTGYSVASVDVTAMGRDIAPFGRATVVGGTAPTLRDGPGNYYNGNGRLAAGESVILTGHRNTPSNWVCVVRDDGTTGWVNTFYLNSSVQFESLRVWPMWIANGEPTATISRDYPHVNLRYGASGSSNVIAQANGGSEVVLVGRSSTNNWILVRMWEGTLGWVPAVTLETRHNLKALPLRYTVAADPAPASE